MAVESRIQDVRVQAEQCEVADEQVKAVRAERAELAERLAEVMDGPLTFLAFVMLGLIIAEYADWIPPALLPWSDRLSTAIWVVFAVEFFARLVLSPNKLDYVRRHWLGAVSVVLPMFRVVRVLRVARAFRSLRLLRLLTSVNRGLREASHTLTGRTLPYFVIATLLVVVAGAAGILALERDASHPVVTNFGDALWWAATLVAANELGERPATPEGRVLALALALFGMAVFGYITAALASTFVGSAGRAQAEASQARNDSLQAELRALREEVQALRARLDG